MTTTLYGIPNCDTVKKARVWLIERGIDYVFHDFKKMGLKHAHVEAWLKQVPWETLVNRKGTTWRGLTEERKASITDDKSAAELMLESPSVIKRPVLVSNGNIHIGFSDTIYQKIFQNNL